MTETAERQQLEALWDAELRRIGRSAVIAELGGMPASPGATFPLYLPDGEGDPSAGTLSSGGDERGQRRRRRRRSATAMASLLLSLALSSPSLCGGSGSPAPFLPPAKPHEGAHEVASKWS